MLRYSPSCSDWGASSPPAGGERARGPRLLSWLPSPPARLEFHPAGTWPRRSHPRPLLLVPPGPPSSSFPHSTPGRSPLASLGRFSPPLLLLLCLLLPWLLPPLCVAGHVWCVCMCVYRPPSLCTWCCGRLTIVPAGFDMRVCVYLLKCLEQAQHLRPSFPINTHTVTTILPTLPHPLSKKNLQNPPL